MVGMRIGTAGLPVTVSQTVLLESLFQRLQFRLRHIARHRATLEVFDHTRFEALVNRAIVHRLAISQLPVLVALFDVLWDIGFELILIHGHHGKARLTAIFGRVVEQFGLDIVGGIVLAL